MARKNNNDDDHIFTKDIIGKKRKSNLDKITIEDVIDETMSKNKEKILDKVKKENVITRQGKILNNIHRKKRFTYRLTDKFLSMLNDLSDFLGKNRNEIIDNALIDYYLKIKCFNKNVDMGVRTNKDINVDMGVYHDKRHDVNMGVRNKKNKNSK